MKRIAPKFQTKIGEKRPFWMSSQTNEDYTFQLYRWLWTYSTNKDFLTKLSRTCTTEIFFILTFKRNIFVHISRHSYLLSDDIKDFPDLWLPYQKMASVSMSVIFSTWASKVMLSAPPDINTLVHNNIQSCCSVSNSWFAQKIKYIEYF